MGSRRGRPSKFGRPARAVALTLPENVIAWLRGLNQDLAWAIVSLVDGLSDGRTPPTVPAPPAELIDVSGRKALIVVNPAVLRRVEGTSAIPLADGRALVALEAGKGAADLELAILDRLTRLRPASPEYRELERLRQSLRRWRSGRGLRLRTRSIIVVERSFQGSVSQVSEKAERRRPSRPGVRLARRRR